MNALKKKWQQGGRGSLNLFVYSLIALAIGLSGIAAWQRYAHVPLSGLGDAVEQRTGALFPNSGLIENWTQVGGFARGVAAPPNSGFVCPQCQSSVWTQGHGAGPLCPFCNVTMTRLGALQQGMGQQGARGALVGGMGTTNKTWPIPIPAGVGCPHADRGPCTNCHTVMKTRAASPAGTAAAARRGPKQLWQGVAAPPIKAGTVKPSLIREFGIEVMAVPGGVKVTGVMGNSFAARAGTKSGDIIIKCNGAKVHGLVQFQKAVGAMIPESNAKIIVLRNGRTKNLSIMVGEGEMEAFLPIKKP